MHADAHTHVHTHLPVPSTSGLQAGEVRAEACCCDHCLPSQREAAGSVSTAGTVWVWLMLPVRNAKSLSLWAIWGRGLVEKVTVEQSSLQNRGWKIGFLFSFAELRSHFSENCRHPARVGDARREIWLIAAGLLTLVFAFLKQEEGRRVN